VDDRALVEAVIAGDQDAFRRLVERETGSVFRVCYRVLGRVHDAQDATQETFVIAYRALPTYRGDGSLAAWLARIATRQALRTASRRTETASLDAETPADGSGHAIDPVSELVEAERAGAIRAAVARLPEPYREVVVLRFFAELSLGEISIATGRPLGTVKSHLHRGLARLRDRLGVEAAA
jgi:RNA polymerase sigma-70 factor (ECF subfamily)